jgi:hypothetical protein
MAGKLAADGSANVTVVGGTLEVEPAAGGATEAKQDTIIGHLDGVETLITATNAAVDGLEGGIGASADAVVDAGAVGSLSAKLRRLTTDLNTALTNLTAIETATEAIQVAAEDDTDVPVTWSHGEDALPLVTVIDTTWTIDTTALASGDVMATDAHEITNFFLTTSSITRIRSVSIHDADDLGVAMDLYLQNAATSLGAQNSAPTVADPATPFIIGYIPVDAANWVDQVNFRTAFVGMDQIPVRDLLANGSSTSVWLTGVVKATADFATTLKLKIVVEQFA